MLSRKIQTLEGVGDWRGAAMRYRLVVSRICFLDALSFTMCFENYVLMFSRILVTISGYQISGCMFQDTRLVCKEEGKYVGRGQRVLSYIKTSVGIISIAYIV